MISFFQRHLFAVLMTLSTLMTLYFWNTQNTNTLNIYVWFDMIPKAIFKSFEKETGIRVVVDYYEDNHVLETKLLTGNSGYDIVFPSAFPYLGRQIKAGFYQPFDKTQLDQIVYMDPYLLHHLRKIDPENAHAVPIIWGLTGFGYDRVSLTKRFPKAPIDSLALLFEPDHVSKIAPCGVFLLNEPNELFAAALVYLDLDPNSESEEDLEKAYQLLLKIRPYIRHFDPNLAADQLAAGNACLIYNWSSDVAIAQRVASTTDRKDHIGFSIPKEGTPLWMDTAAIPKDAEHVENAHKFINYLMRPEIIAQLTNVTHLANANTQAHHFTDPAILENTTIYPPKRTLKKVYFTSVSTPKRDRLLTRYMTKLKVGGKN